MRSLSALAALCFAVVLPGCAGLQVPREQLTDPGALLFNGYTRPEVGCYRCHGGEAKGASRGPSLAKRVPKYSAEQLFTIIRDGKRNMPKYGPQKITDEQITQVVGWLQGTFPSAQ